MQPIVNGFEIQYSTTIIFHQFNVNDNAQGEAYFQQAGLRGHPGILIYDATGKELYRGIGLVGEESLQTELTALLE